MMLPYLESENATRDMISTFEGYVNNERCSEAQGYDEVNISSDLYPLLAPRDKRVVFKENLSKVRGMHVNNGLLVIQNENQLYFEGELIGTLPRTGERKMCSMGAYIIIFPDKVRFNTLTKEIENLGSSFSYSGSVTFTPCKLDGTTINPSIGTSAPSNPTSGQYWLDTSTTPHTLKMWAAYQSAWVSVPTSYAKISATGIGKNFNKLDVVSISGISGTYAETFNTDMQIWDKDDNSIVVTALIGQVFTNTGITITRQPPDMDFICELDNRIWGCSSANHEIYASKLGDPTNWKSYAGTAADAYAVTVGTDGDFTGCATQGGCVIFFKEKYIHKIYGKQPSNFTVDAKPERGVQAGSHKSIQLISGVLFYKAVDGVCIYEGSYPRLISGALGMTQYREASAGSWNGKYYIRMLNNNTVSTLFVYDSEKQFWHKEDTLVGTPYDYFVNYKNRMFFYDSDEGRILVEGSETKIGDVRYDLEEDEVAWSRTFGITGLSEPYKQYISQLLFRFSMALGSEMSIWIEYDSSGTYEKVAEFKNEYKVSRRDTSGYTKLRSMEVPIVPKRCDHLRLRVVGTGMVKIFSIAKKIETGGAI